MTNGTALLRPRPSYPSVPVLRDPGRTGRLRTLAPTSDTAVESGKSVVVSVKLGVCGITALLGARRTVTGYGALLCMQSAPCIVLTDDDSLPGTDAMRITYAFHLLHTNISLLVLYPHSSDVSVVK
jgi:hypothetical protein